LIKTKDQEENPNNKCYSTTGKYHISYLLKLLFIFGRSSVHDYIYIIYNGKNDYVNE